MTAVEDKPPTASIVVTTPALGKLPPPADTLHRAVHSISLSALSHNYSEVESAAQKQCCDVICVTKADSYGHGAIASALYLADNLGAGAFAVATLEEAIALRKAFQESNDRSSSSGNVTPKAKGLVSSLFQPVSDDVTLSTTISLTTSTNLTATARRRTLRPPNIRILVLGPPVGFPRCFDDYFHHNIEVMISGPEVARALYEWVHDPNERKRVQVERVAEETKKLALNGPPAVVQRQIPKTMLEHRESNVSDASTSETSQNSETARLYRPSATLGNVTGSDLAKEVREILRNQKLTAETQQSQQAATRGSQKVDTGALTPQTLDSSKVTPVPSETDLASGDFNKQPSNTQPFAGIEEAARVSRNIQKAAASEVFMDTGDDDDIAGDAPAKNPSKGRPTTPVHNNKKGPAVLARRRMRWHALVDSGMGRLGFRTDPISKEEHGKRRDSVEVIKELVDLEVKFDCPIEFFGMVTHMADANSTSTYTNDQIVKFKSLLKRVRARGISVPTISTDNSAALLTTTLTHFDPKALLQQEFANTRGFVRVGGAIYGQRPAFQQLQAVSTLMASVRHVAVLKKGESVGYDRAYVADRSVRIATLTIGFADGYPRELGNKNGRVVIRGSIYPVVGNICMDMMMVELGDAGNDGAGAEIVVGDTAILWGPGDDGVGEGLVSLRELAEKLKTTQSALTCGLDKERVLRQYI